MECGPGHRDACQVGEGGVTSTWGFLVSTVRRIGGPEGQMTWGAQISLIRVLLGMGRYLGQVQTSLGQDHVGGCSWGTEVHRGKGASELGRGQEEASWSEDFGVVGHLMQCLGAGAGLVAGQMSPGVGGST